MSQGKIYIETPDGPKLLGELEQREVEPPAPAIAYTWSEQDQQRLNAMRAELVEQLNAWRLPQWSMSSCRSWITLRTAPPLTDEQRTVVHGIRLKWELRSIVAGNMPPIGIKP